MSLAINVVTSPGLFTTLWLILRLEEGGRGGGRGWHTISPANKTAKSYYVNSTYPIPVTIQLVAHIERKLTDNELLVLEFICYTHTTLRRISYNFNYLISKLFKKDCKKRRIFTKETVHESK